MPPLFSFKICLWGLSLQDMMRSIGIVFLYIFEVLFVFGLIFLEGMLLLFLKIRHSYFIPHTILALLGEELRVLP